MDTKHPIEGIKSFIFHLNRRRLFLFGSYIYWVLSIISFIVNRNWIKDLGETANYQETCYRTDALLIYVECKGFFGANVAEFVLGLYWTQYQTLYATMTGITVLSGLGPSELFFSLFLAIWGALYWLPLAYPFWFLLTRKRKDDHGTL